MHEERRNLLEQCSLLLLRPLLRVVHSYVREQRRRLFVMSEMPTKRSGNAKDNHEILERIFFFRTLSGRLCDSISSRSRFTWIFAERSSYGTAQGIVNQERDNWRLSIETETDTGSEIAQKRKSVYTESFQTPACRRGSEHFAADPSRSAGLR